MTTEPNLVHLRVWGDFGCFTRPEMKVERVSYPIMTPSAARGILEAIFWEPQIYYLIDRIRVLRRGKWVSIRRNEVQKVISLDGARTWMTAPEKAIPIKAGAGADTDATQRSMLALQDVAYVISAEIRMTAMADRPGETPAKYVEEFCRRATAGKCFHRPGLGMREFAADFEGVTAPDAFPAEQWSEELGLTLYDVFDHREREQGFRWLRPEEIVPAPTGTKSRGRKKALPVQNWKGLKIQPQAAFFVARLVNGVMDCHPERVELRFQAKGGE